jgi:hypothetical protein
MRAAVALTAALLAAPAAAQLMGLGDAASEAASLVEEAAQDALLVGDLMGADVTDPAGDAVGTVANLVAAPGGTLIAVLVEPEGGGEPLLVPYKAATVSMKADALGLSLPAPMGELRGSEAVRELSQALGGVLTR